MKEHYWTVRGPPEPGLDYEILQDYHCIRCDLVICVDIGSSDFPPEKPTGHAFGDTFDLDCDATLVGSVLDE